MNHFRNFLFLILTFFVCELHAQVKLPAIISDGMVLQQQSTVSLWGWAHPGEKIMITNSWSSKKQVVTASASGKWMVKMATGKAGGPYTISFMASNKVVVHDVLLGEVWLASGQSNMEYYIGKIPNSGYRGVINHDEVLKDAEHPDIRTIDIPNRVSDEPQDDFSGKWIACNDQTVDSFSAVAYFFAREVNKATGFPVGIINATWGGTPAESWTKKEVLQNDSMLQTIVSNYEKKLAVYPEAFAKYQAALASWKADTSKLKRQAPRPPVGPDHFQSPYKLYNGMIVPIQPYTLKGVIWYQGEANAGRAWQYRRLFPALISNWRHDWNNSRLPFYFVQISPHKSQNAEIRDAQLYTYKTVPFTGMAVTTDNGDSLNIHPPDKEIVGKRLALWALHNQYGKTNLVTSGPIYRSMKTEGNRIRISFDFDKELIAKNGTLKEFTIAGDDQEFVPAHARIEGNTVIVWSDKIVNPVAVRFAWKNVPDPNFYNAAGLPASPFRTDSWKVKTQ